MPTGKGKAKRAANGAGNIRRKEVVRNGKTYKYWDGRITVGIKPDGTQDQKSFSAATQTEVRKKITEAMRQVDTDTYIQPDKIKVSKWINIWLDKYTTDVKDSSAETYRYNMEHFVIPYLGGIKLQKLTKDHLQTWVNELKKTVSPKMVHDLSGLLHGCLAEAAEQKIISKNVCSNLSLPKIPKPDLQLPSISQVVALLEAMKDNRFANLFETAIYTGLREAELLGLSWGQIEIERDALHINRQLSYDRTHAADRFITQPKCEEIRDVPLTPALLKVFDEQKKVVEDMREQAGNEWIERGLIFPAPNGDFLSRSTVYQNFKKVASAAGLPNMRLHDLRHVFTMLSLSYGTDPTSVQKALGHKDSKITMEIYSYVNNDTRKRASERMQDAFGSLRVSG